MRVAFFGLPLAAVLLSRDGHELVYAAASRLGPGFRRLATSIAPGRTFSRPDVASPDTLERVRGARPDLLVSWFWTSRLPVSLLDVAPSIGVHPSLLPRHRGPDPYFWAIDAGDQVTGVTAHKLAPEYDTGAILAQSALRIDATWDSWQLARALDRPALALLRRVVRSYALGVPPAPVVQDESAATYAPEPTDEEVVVRWQWTADRIERRVRAAAPWPGASTEIGPRTIALLRVKPTSSFPSSLAPGEAAVRADGIAVVRASDRAVELLQARDEDDASLCSRDLAALVEEERQRALSRCTAQCATVRS